MIPHKKGGGEASPLASASSPKAVPEPSRRAAVSSATPLSGAAPRNAPEAPLVNLCDQIVDCPHSTPIWTNSGKVVLRSSNIRGGRLDLSDKSFTDDRHFADRIRRAKPRAGDLVITREAPMGEVCLIPDGLECCLGQRMVLLRPKTAEIDPTYLLYAIQSPAVQHQIGWAEGTGSTVSNLRIPHLEALKIPAPALSVQKFIAHILGTLDDKIELNRRINQTLEEMAQALFKSWFVDFDPVKAKMSVLESGGTSEEAEQAAMQIISGKTAEELEAFRQSDPNAYADLAHTASLFPSRLVESELGQIPEGWELQRIDSLLELAYGKSLSKTERINGVVPVYGSGGLTGTHNAPLVNGPGIIVGRKGTVGSLYWENNDFFPIDTVFYVVPNPGIPMIFLFELLKTLGLSQMNTDAAVPGLNRNNVYRLLVPGCPINLIQEFSAAAAGFRAGINRLQNGTEALVVLRDSLLPKLLSGELEIPDELISEVAA